MHQIITFIAKDFLVLPVLLAAVVWLRLPRRQKITFVILGLASAVLAVLFAKLGSHLFYNPRPFVAGNFTPYFAHASDNGFPSDHTLLAGVVSFATFVYSRRYGWVAIALSVLIGLSRVIAGVHHLIDVIGSLAIAALSVGLTQALIRWWLRRQKTT